MSKLNRNELGVSPVEFLMLIVIIILIAAVGYFVYRNHHQTVKVVTVTRTITKPAATNTTITNYLVIKELGIKLPLSSGISDLVYAYNPTQKAFYFSTTSLDNYGSACTPLPTAFGAFGFVTAETSPLPSSEVGTSDDDIGVLYSHANGYYIYWKGEQSSCLQTSANGGMPSQAASNLLLKQEPLFQASLKSAIAN